MTRIPGERVVLGASCTVSVGPDSRVCFQLVGYPDRIKRMMWECAVLVTERPNSDIGAPELLLSWCPPRDAYPSVVDALDAFKEIAMRAVPRFFPRLVAGHDAFKRDQERRRSLLDEQVRRHEAAAPLRAEYERAAVAELARRADERVAAAEARAALERDAHDEAHDEWIWDVCPAHGPFRVGRKTGGPMMATCPACAVAGTGG